ncbi:hypothetical protein Pan1_81 [Pseudanabaena phage Pan1]|nr:hypothetical protein Pan1_81 [Pseudanabaena phage Pan1]
MNGFDALGPGWEMKTTLSGQPMAWKPGFEVHQQLGVDEQGLPVYVAIAISSRYRFVAYGTTPRFALEGVAVEMRKFIDELERHLTHV